MLKIVKNRQKSSKISILLFGKGVFKLHWVATTKSRQIEHSVFFCWNTSDKHEVSDWSKVNRMFGCGEIVILREKMMIRKNAPSNFIRLPQLNQDKNTGPQQTKSSYRLVLGPRDVQLQGNRDSPTEEDDCAPSPSPR